MMIVRVYRRAAPGKVRQKCDRAVFNFELPALRVVARRCKRRITNQFIFKRSDATVRLQTIAGAWSLKAQGFLWNIHRLTVGKTVQSNSAATHAL
jgi:hypothetical protein